MQTAPPASPTFCPMQVLVVQFLPAQHAWPTIPQLVHCAEETGSQPPLKQQLPLLHALPGQHDWPLPPQRTQLLALSQVVLAPVHSEPAQQG